MSADTLRSGQLAAAVGVNVQTLRYYERRGLLTAPGRTLGGHRVYPPDAVTLLRVIKAAQRLGFTLDEVADLLELGQHRHGRGADAGLQAQARAKLTEIQARMEDLEVIQAALLAAIDAGCDDLMACADSDLCPLPFADIGTRAGETEEPKPRQFKSGSGVARAAGEPAR